MLRIKITFLPIFLCGITFGFDNNYDAPSMVRICDKEAHHVHDNEGCLGVIISPNAVLVSKICLRRLRDPYLYSGYPFLDCHSSRGQSGHPVKEVPINIEFELLYTTEGFTFLDTSMAQMFGWELHAPDKQRCFTYQFFLPNSSFPPGYQGELINYETYISGCVPSTNGRLCGTINGTIPENISLLFSPVFCSGEFAGFTLYHNNQNVIIAHPPAVERDDINEKVGCLLIGPHDRIDDDDDGDDASDLQKFQEFTKRCTELHKFLKEGFRPFIPQYN